MDGLTNFQEFLAGTDPLNANSVLRIVRITPCEDGLALTWKSASNQVYALEIAADALEGFLPFASGIPATPPANVYTCVLDTVTAPRVFFRVIVE